MSCQCWLIFCNSRGDSTQVRSITREIFAHQYIPPDGADEGHFTFTVVIIVTFAEAIDGVCTFRFDVYSDIGFVCAFFTNAILTVWFLQTLLKMGKVHGSLARAGKVKNQTPKVEKQEDKKKLPRGRAKKRLQYNRRYVNVVSGMGGKRVGPNSNADRNK